ncbi:MAG: PDZ domain-containing protein [Singulisphaera sp.]
MLVWRDRKYMSMKVTVGDKDPLTQASPPVSRATSDRLLRRPDRPSSATSFALGLELATLDEAGTQRLGLPRAMRGATVMKVFPDSPLAKHFRPLDVIQTVNGRAIRSADDVVKALERRADGESVELVVDRVNRGVIERLTFWIP